MTEETRVTRDELDNAIKRINREGTHRILRIVADGDEYVIRTDEREPRMEIRS